MTLHRIGVGLGTFILCLALAEDARACSCASENHVLLASASTLAPAAGPWLVWHSEGVVPRLTDAEGSPVPTETVRSYSTLNLCKHSFDLVRPVTTLDSGATYELSLVSTVDDEVLDSRSFRAINSRPLSVTRALTVSIERSVEPGVISGASCGPPELEGQPIDGSFFARIEVDRPSLLFVEVSAQDTMYGSLVEGDATIGFGLSSERAVTNVSGAWIPKLSSTATCARVVVRDSQDVSVFDEVLCPGPNETITTQRQVTVAEHLVREQPVHASGGCVFARGSRASSAGWISCLLLVLGVLGVFRAREP